MKQKMTIGLLVLFILGCSDTEESINETGVKIGDMTYVNYTITTNAENGGSITETQTIEKGKTTRIIASPKENYQLKEWTGSCGVFDKKKLTITFTATKNCRITAIFELPYTLDKQTGIIKMKEGYEHLIGKKIIINDVEFHIPDDKSIQVKIINNKNVITTYVTDMSRLFKYNDTIKQDLSTWDTSNVTDMSEMFFGSASFNQPIGGWDTSKVQSTNRMFYHAKSFNQDISKWDTSNIYEMKGMFAYATSFNQPIEEWNISKVKAINGMFYNAKSFNQDIRDWDTSKVKNMVGMFFGATSFNRPIGEWDTSNITEMWVAFYSAKNFNQDISQWNVSNVEDMYQMFFQAEAFDQNISGWNVEQVTDCNRFSKFSPLKKEHKPKFKNCNPENDDSYFVFK